MGFSLISGAEILFHFLASICKENGKELSESQKDVEIAVSETDKDGSGKQNIPSPIPIMRTVVSPLWVQLFFMLALFRRASF